MKKRGSIRKSNATGLTVWVPVPLGEALDREVVSKDLDRSKYIRAALREKLERDGVRMEPALA